MFHGFILMLKSGAVQKMKGLPWSFPCKPGYLFLVIPDIGNRESLFPPSCPTLIIGHPSVEDVKREASGVKSQEKCHGWRCADVCSPFDKGGEGDFSIEME
jgi:hypothetical protein